MSKILIVLGIILLILLLSALYITRDGKLVTPVESGLVTTASGDFEALPLPQYVTDVIGQDYKSYLIEVEPGIKVHMLEVGQGFPVYMQHGNPTSGLLYRKIAAELPTDRLRLIMPTLVGLGFSSKVPANQHRVDNHIRWIHAALAQLQLQELVYVGQDWGGPVGMGALGRMPGTVKGAVILNTGFGAPTEKRDISSVHAMLKRPLVGELIAETMDKMFSSLPGVQGDPESLSDSVLKLYQQPLLDAGNIKAPLAMARMVPDGPEHESAAAFREVEAYASTLDIPAEIVWGSKDPILGAMLPNTHAFFPDAPLTKTDAGHFLQEEVPEQIAAAIVRVIDKLTADPVNPLDD